TVLIDDDAEQVSYLVRRWDPTTGQDQPALEYPGRLGLSGPVFSPKGEWLFVGTEDGDVLALQAATGREVWKASLAKESPFTLALSADGKTLFAKRAGDPQVRA